MKRAQQLVDEEIVTPISILIRTRGVLQTGNFTGLLSLVMMGTVVTLHAQTNPGGDGAMLKLAPADPEIPPTFWDVHHLAILICGVGLILLLALLLWILLKPKPAVMVPPEMVAHEALTKLSGQPEDGSALSGVSQILQHYFSAAFGMPTGERTTAEFCAAIAGHDEISPGLAGPVSEFLRQCDARKFGTAPGSEPFQAVNRALELIELAEKHRRAKELKTN